ncbi:hypothetical protein FOYG_17506 [Fusarium oxysporum NRRL 32931]|uniref:Uncharacterized protein n=1 Tax=Fusarium oxysporum NRRL 32931 TaxID=660029 RepID=W9H9S2_FUSOX|nr:hypothetical protein FOYG_17506 [Fusarium oxysporum NRRL 32931]
MTVMPHPPILSPLKNLSGSRVSGKPSPTLATTSSTLLVSLLSASTRPTSSSLPKIDGIKAPASAPAGPEGTGAVDWLYLGDIGGSQGVSFVYRVLTAGGASHGCEVQGTDSTSYTTLYWLYG